MLCKILGTYSSCTKAIFIDWWNSLRAACSHGLGVNPDPPTFYNRNSGNDLNNEQILRILWQLMARWKAADLSFQTQWRSLQHQEFQGCCPRRNPELTKKIRFLLKSGGNSTSFAFGRPHKNLDLWSRQVSLSLRITAYPPRYACTAWYSWTSGHSHKWTTLLVYSKCMNKWLLCL